MSTKQGEISLVANTKKNAALAIIFNTIDMI